MNEIEKKEIEEMARVVSMNCGECDTCKFLGKATNKIDCIDFFAANELYEQGYRQCKDKVVLSREEYEEMIADIKVSKEKLARIIDSAKDKARKETAEKILKEILFVKSVKGWQENKQLVEFGNRIVDKIEELAKQFGVEEL